MLQEAQGESVMAFEAPFVALRWLLQKLSSGEEMIPIVGALIAQANTLEQTSICGKNAIAARA